MMERLEGPSFMAESDTEIKPRFPIRRFDVFAEYNRVKNLADGMPEPVAKGRALWVAKVVAGRRGGSVLPAEPSRGHGTEGGTEDHQREEREDGFRSVGGVVQTDAMFDKEIVDRMGKEFYDEVFRPAVDAAFKDGKQYTEIRDSIRKGWK
jgi:hypothetical protein